MCFVHNILYHTTVILVTVSLRLFVPCIYIGAEIPIPFQIVPQGLQTVNGSKSDMGCTHTLVDMDGLSSCGSPNNSSVSCLSDGVSPEINPYISNWASELVTVKKNTPTDNVHYDHVVLTFGFDTNVTLTTIELDVYLCPEWNISAPYITLFGGAEDSLIFRADGDDRDFLVNYHPSEPSCGCLSTVRMPIQQGEPSYAIWHIVVSFHLQPQIQWVHVGEVRFLDTPIEPGSHPTTFCRLPDPPPSESYIQNECGYSLLYRIGGWVGGWGVGKEQCCNIVCITCFQNGLTVCDYLAHSLLLYGKLNPVDSGTYYSFSTVLHHRIIYTI